MKKYIIIMLILVSTLLVNGTSISASSNENVDYYFYQKDNKDYFKLEKKLLLVSWNRLSSIILIHKYYLFMEKNIKMKY